MDKKDYMSVVISNLSVERIREVLMRLMGSSAEDRDDAREEAVRDIVLIFEDQVSQQERQSAALIGGPVGDRL